MDKSNFYLQLKEEEKALLETLSALQVLIKRYEVNNPASVTTSPVENNQELFRIDIKKDSLLKFRKNMSITEKIIFTLNSLGKATSKEVGQKMHEIDSSYKEEKAIDDARYHLSRLYKEGKLSVASVGAGKRGHLYVSNQSAS